MDFIGAAAALLCGNEILIVLRDDDPSIPFPNMWSLPGGSKEKEETPFQCVSREVEEELNIKVLESSVLWEKIYPSIIYDNKFNGFFVINITQKQVKQVRLGDEGQKWMMVTITDYLNLNNIVPQKERVSDYLEQLTDTKL